MRFLLLGGTGQVGEEFRALSPPDDVEVESGCSRFGRAGCDRADHRGGAVERGHQCGGPSIVQKARS
jgi:hypothetical protein